ncbi:taurine catabolism dioxygenase [Athelia psychrophila]|uniref:Taurine catabolism dioxygenase n=1 Tax=Athelia psychrophila TaxID=1759441 RepID=A0A166LGA4_9AGAM|nr:taurine catabolism dioxygenase [Fibularhizoctonia sp. CBS 109695]
MVAAPFSPLGSLADFPHRDETLHIGTRFPSPTTQLSALLAAPNARELVTDLATLVSHRGVVFFADQDITIAQQTRLAELLGACSGRPSSSGLHRHPISEETSELGAEVSVIDSKGGIARADLVQHTRASRLWHADITFERVPSDYALLKMHTLPPVGGDTLWASGYEAYDRLSPPFARFLEGLTAVHNADFFVEHAQRTGIPIQDPRGSPENTGSELTAVHPVIRTHPVTGFKTLFVNRTFTKRIVELSPDESDTVLEYLFRHVAENHDLQVRYRWRANDLAIWDNRCTFHTATNDYEAHRQGNRVVGIGEKPYFDAASKSRREVLGVSVP